VSGTTSMALAHRPNAGAMAICGKVEAELAEMDDAEAGGFPGELRAARERTCAADPGRGYELLG